MTPGTSRKLCSGLWDTISTSVSGIIHQGKGYPLPNRFIEAIGSCRGSVVIGKSRFSSLSTPWSSPRSTFNSKRQFFTISFSIHPHTLVSSPRSRYVLSRGFASGFVAWQSVPPTTPTTVTQAAESIIAPAASSIANAIGPGKALVDCPTCTRIADKKKLSSLAILGWKRCISTVHRSQQTGGRKIPAKVRSSNITTSATVGKYSKGPNGGSGGGGGNGGNVSNDWKMPPRRGNNRLNGINKPNGKDRPYPTVPAKPKSTLPTVDPGILNRIAQMHRPTKDEMLAAATGFFERLRIRTKWIMIRQMRPYNLEDLMAFFSWLFVGHVLWVVLGTTTFMSIAILLVNTVFAQERLASIVGNYLTKETGIKVVFESAIVPRWKDGCISFKNVFVSRRAGGVKGNKSSVQKGSSATAAAAAAAAVHADDAGGRDNAARSLVPEHEEEEDTNYTQFDLTVEEVNVTLSVAKWMNGKGLLKDVDVKGVRGVIDRAHVTWDDAVDPRTYRHVHQPGDFEIESFKLEDLLVTVYQPDGFRPFSISIFQCDLPQLRKQWLFYDFLSASNMSGSYDDSLFTIHPRQSHGISPSRQLSGGDSGGFVWKKMSRLRIDGLEIDHLNRGIEGPFGWIQQGNVDIIADVMFPEDADDLDFSKMVQDIVGRVGETVSSSGISSTINYNPLARNSQLQPPITSSSVDVNSTDTENLLSQSSSSFSAQHNNNPTTTPSPAPSTTPAPPPPIERFIILDLHVQLNSVRATVPIFPKDLSYVNSALIRPIVAYINSRKTYIPIHCRVVKRQSEFDGSWTVFDSGLMDDLSAETYTAFARTVMDRQARRRRFRKVGLWSLQILVQAVLMAMTGQVI